MLMILRLKDLLSVIPVISVVLSFANLTCFGLATLIIYHTMLDSPTAGVGLALTLCEVRGTSLASKSNCH